MNFAASRLGPGLDSILYSVGGKRSGGGFQKRVKQQPKADHKDPQNIPPSVANFGSWFGRKLRRRTAERISETVEARVS